MIRSSLRSSLATKPAARSSHTSGGRAPFLTLYNIPTGFPLLLVLLAMLLSAAGVVGVLRLHPDARVDLLVDPNSAAFKDQALFADTFGADPVVIMAQPAAGASLITPGHIVGLSHLEGKLHQAAGVKKVYGPGTLVNTLAISTTTILLNASLDQVRHIVSIVNNASSAGDLSELHDLRFVATGSPVLTLSVADAVFDALKLLLPLALLAVLVVALLAMGASMLLTIVVAALAALWTAGVAGFVGLPVTPATLVVLPVVLGLATDYLVQSVNRVMDTAGTMEERVELAAGRILPSTGLAAAATAAGMLAFVVSGIPLVRQFGLFMALGVVMAYVANYLVGLPLLLLLGRRFPQLFAGTAIRSAAGRRIATIGALAPRVAMVLAVLGLLGWAALPLINVETDPARLMPAGDRALAQADQVRREVGIAGEIDLVIQGNNPTQPDAVKWLDQATGQAVRDSGHDLKA